MPKRTGAVHAEHRAIAALEAVLPHGVAATTLTTHDAGYDVLVAGQRLHVKWLGEGTLGRVRQLLKSGPPWPDIVVARQFSPGAMEALSESGVGWVDEGGSAEIAIGTIIVSRWGRPRAPGPEQRWTSAVTGVAEAVLCGVPATVAATQEATGYSVGACTKALALMEDRGLLVASAARGRGSARRVEDLRALLDAYQAAVAAAPAPLSLDVGVTWDDPVGRVRAIGATWSARNVAWAASGALAAELMAPFLSGVDRALVYVDEATPLGLEAAAKTVGLEPIEGGRLTLRPFPTPATLRLSREAEGLRLVPWPRVYVDLAAVGVRGEDAAEHLLEVLGVG